jgi:glutathione S-transferase
MVETFFLPPERQSEVHAKRAKKLLGQMLVAVDTALEGKRYLAAEFSAADIMTGSAAMSAKTIGVDMAALRNLSAYIDRLATRPAYERATAL